VIVFVEVILARQTCIMVGSREDMPTRAPSTPPASSKIGIAVGLSRAGYLGALAAWAGFTLPPRP